MNRDPSMGAGYLVELDAFRGPLDLLLQLIERNELDISEISLCAVTDQYLKTIETLSTIEPIALADFLAIASRLLYLKSNRLLPRPAIDEEDEEDAGDALVRQLIEYRQFRQAAEELKERTDAGQRVHVRQIVKPPVDRRQIAPSDLSSIDSEDLQSVLRSVLQRIPVEPPPPRYIAYRVTVAEQIDRVRAFVLRAQTAGGKRKTRVLFASVLGAAYTRTEVVVTFLAILELIKQQELTVEQDATFGDIYLLPLNLELPAEAGADAEAADAVLPATAQNHERAAEESGAAKA